MNCKSRFAVVGIVALIAAAGTLAFAQSQPPKDKKPSTPPAKSTPPAAAGDHQLPPGMTEADMQACMEAATPGPQHEHLAKSIGVWTGKSTMWMTPEAEPMNSECTAKISAMMDGKFTKVEVEGEMPAGMGPFNGFGLYGYDNVGKEFQATWIDSCGTGMSVGTGELSSDGKTMTWSYKFNCPIAKKLVNFRQVERYTSKDSMTLEMYAPDKTGKEFKVMEIVYARKAGAGAAAAAGTN